MISRRSRRRGQRKSPHSHEVKGHIRNGTQVGKYQRGKGRKPRQPKRSRRTSVMGNPGLKAIPSKFRKFHVSVRFVRGDESLSVDSTSFAGAVTQGLKKRERVEEPRSILVRRILK